MQHVKQKILYQLQFEFKLLTGPQLKLSVRTFETKRHGLGDAYSYQLHVVSENAISLDELLTRKAQLVLKGTSSCVYINGIVSQVKFCNKERQRFVYEVFLTSPLLLLDKNIRSQVFINKSIPKIAESIITSIIPDLKIICALKQRYPTIPMLSQLNETNYDFLRRILFEVGISFSFYHHETTTQLVLFDNISELSPRLKTPLCYTPHNAMQNSSDAISHLEPTTHLLASGIKIQQQSLIDSSNELTLKTHKQSDVNATGTKNCFLTTENKQSYLKLQATAWQKSLDTQRYYLHAISDCFAIVPGMKVTLRDHPNSKYNRDYRVLEMSAAGQQAGTSIFNLRLRTKEFPYQNHLLLIPANQDFAPQKAEIPRTNSILLASIESDNPHAQLEDDGRYRLRLAYDRGENEKNHASPPISFIQSYGGPNLGYHYPLVDGAKVAVSCLYGDLNQPVVLGALPSKNIKSVVNNDNITEHVFRSPLGHEMIYSDHPQQSKITYQSAQRQNHLSMLAKEEDSHISLHSQGDVLIFAGKDIKRDFQQQHVQTSCNTMISVANNQDIVTQTKDLLHQSGKNININSQGTSHLAAGQEGVQKTFAESYSINSKETINLLSQEKNVCSLSTQETHLHSDNQLLLNNKQSDGALNINVSQHLLQLRQNNNMITAKTASLSAPIINICANQVAKHSNQSNSTGTCMDTVSALKQHTNHEAEEMYFDEDEFLKTHFEASSF